MHFLEMWEEAGVPGEHAYEIQTQNLSHYEADVHQKLISQIEKTSSDSSNVDFFFFFVAFYSIIINFIAITRKNDG